MMGFSDTLPPPGHTLGPDSFVQVEGPGESRTWWSRLSSPQGGLPHFILEPKVHFSQN